MNLDRSTRNLRRLIFALVILLTVEGILRKLAGPSLKEAIFFLKDFFVVLLGFYVFRLPKPPSIRFLWNAYLLILVLFLPLVVVTALHDPLLAVFGTERYLLFPVVCFAVFAAFHEAPLEEIYKFLARVSLLVIPTTALAILQSNLPKEHWLNLSVYGDSLTMFAAADQLRVSSTFPFVAQYCMFLNAQTFFVASTLIRIKEQKGLWKFLYLSLIPFLVIGMFITGSRGAVIGNIAVLSLGGILATVKKKGSGVGFVIGATCALFLTIFVARSLFPTFFAAYLERESGRAVSLSTENQDRIWGMLFGWRQDAGGVQMTLFGQGLGVMSNGSSKLSAYAGSWRQYGAWTETDFLTTLFEGGLYLIVIWFGFRLFVIYRTLKNYLLAKSEEYVLYAAFAQGFVIIMGFSATLGIQPPIAIWFWMIVGFGSLFSLRLSTQPEPVVPPPAPGPPRPNVLSRPGLRGRSEYAERMHGTK